MKPSKHTVASLQAAISAKGGHHLTVLSVEGNRVALMDKDYGPYHAALVNFCPSSQIPTHKKRRHAEKVSAIRSKYVGTTIAGLNILDVFYGPDRGYRNRSFYIEYQGMCGHVCVDSRAAILNHRKSYKCSQCRGIIHGARGKTGGVRIKRTNTYIYWVGHKKKLPEHLANSYQAFLDAVGERPDRKAHVVQTKEGISWESTLILADEDTTLMAQALRSAFRHSSLYKKALSLARVESDTATRYICADCGEAFPLNKVQVDHIDPVNPIDGSPLTPDLLLGRIWTDKVQVLHKDCHTKKSSLENKIRKQNKLAKRSSSP